MTKPQELSCGFIIFKNARNHLVFCASINYKVYLNMKMKYVFGIFVMLLLSTASCSLPDNEGSPVSFEIVKIVSVELPNSFTLGETHDIVVRYEVPSTCHVFSGFEVIPLLNQRTVNAVSTVIPNGNCVDQQQVFEEQVYRFRVTSNGSYIFKFFTGLDADGLPEYIEREVFVIN